MCKVDTRDKKTGWKTYQIWSDLKNPVGKIHTDQIITQTKITILVRTTRRGSWFLVPGQLAEGHLEEVS